MKLYAIYWKGMSDPDSTGTTHVIAPDILSAINKMQTKYPTRIVETIMLEGSDILER
jgi:hypothetical protein